MIHASRLIQIIYERSRKSLVNPSWLALTFLVIAFVGVVAYALARSELVLQSPLRQTKYAKKWITASATPAQAVFLRKTIHLSSPVRHAWIRIAAEDAFEFSVNRNPLARHYLWRPTRPYQSGTSERGQVLLWQDPAMALNFPREYQWDGHDNWRLPMYSTFTSSLRPGKNVLCLELESRCQQAKANIEGEILLWTGETIPICSDESWRASNAMTTVQRVDWTETNFVDLDWSPAIECVGPAYSGYRSNAVEIYRDPFEANWMQSPAQSNSQQVEFELDWKIDGRPAEAWLRLVTNRTYEVFVNDIRVEVDSIRPPDLDNGNWVFGRGSAKDPSAKPELLDPDEVGSSFVGKSFLTPRSVDQEVSEFESPFARNASQFHQRRAFHRDNISGEFETKRSLAETRRAPARPAVIPNRPMPNALKRQSYTGGFLAYDISSIVRQGENVIRIRCLQRDKANWQTQIAVDGGCLTRTGERIDLPKANQWRVVGADGKMAPVIVAGKAHQVGETLPNLQYRGRATNPRQFDQILPAHLQSVAIHFGLFLGFVLFIGTIIDRTRTIRELGTPGGTDTRSFVRSLGKMLFAMILLATIVVSCGLFIEMSWMERHEVLWCLDGTIWKWTFAAAFLAAGIAGLADLVAFLRPRKAKQHLRGLSATVRDLTQTKIWIHACILVLVLAAFLRAYKLDLQPLDDDEYASVQAVLAIMETGAPAFVPEDVYYTRSPLFHYLTAALALPFGANLWSLRWQTVLWGVATTWLTYLCGAHLLRSRWIGFVAMLLVAVHPFEIFTGHVIRFYQIQQFFALLTVYCFCRGFVGSRSARAARTNETEGQHDGISTDDSIVNTWVDFDQSQGWRIATILAFCAAVLSQEITIALGPALLFGYMIFARDFGWQKNIQLAIWSALAIGLIGFDVIAFQTLCLTRTEGVSPSIEATIKPHFWHPMNLFSVFIGYARLHVVPSFFLFLGMPLLWKTKNRNAMALVAFLFAGIVITNVLVTNVSLRYLYWIFPLWILLSVDGMRQVAVSLVSLIYRPTINLNRYVMHTTICFGLFTCCVLVSWSLWRIPGSYELSILGDSTRAMRWISSQKAPGDRVAVSEPHTHCAFLEAGKCDYDLAIPLLYDFAVMRDGKLVDRNGGGLVVSNLDDLINVFSQGDRVWIALNREKFRTRGKNLRWEYPGARFELFIRKNCQLKYRTYLWSVYLWDPANGFYVPFQMQE